FLHPLATQCNAGVSNFNTTTNAWRTFIPSSGGILDSEIYSLLVDSSNRVWIGSESGPQFFDGVAWRTPVPPPPIRPTGRVLCQDQFGDVWIGAQSLADAFRFDGRHWESEGFGGTAPTAMLEDRNGTLWAGTSSGAIQRDGIGSGAPTRLITTGDGLLANVTDAIHLDRQGRIWVGNQDG